MGDNAERDEKMKKNICFLIVLVLVLTACSKPAEGGDLSTESEISQPSEDGFFEGGADAFESFGNGDVVPLEGGHDFLSKYAVETGGTIVFSGEHGELTLFDAASGKRLYESEARNGYVIRLDEYTEKSGYDYRLIMEDRVVYRSTGGSEKELTEMLPGNLSFDHDSFPCEVKNIYDINEEAFVWASDDGIMLSDPDGSNAELILDNADLSDVSKLLTDIDLEFVFEAGFSFLYQNPCFILGGTKLVAGIISQEGIYYGIVIYDIATGEIDSGYGFYEPDSPIYPVDDRYAVLQSSFDCIIIDALTGEAEKSGERFPVRSVCTKDYQTAIVCYYGLDDSGDPADRRNLRAYVCDMDNLGDKSSPLVFAADPNIESFLTVVSKNYAIISVYGNAEDPAQVYAVKIGKP